MRGFYLYFDFGEGMAKTEINDTQIFPGSSNQILGVNNAGTSDEYKTLSGTSNEITVTHGVGSITLSTPQAIATTSSPSFQQITLGSTSLGGVVFNDTEATSKTVTLEAPTTITSSYVLKLPTSQSSGTQILTNDGSGNLSWSTSSGSGTVNSGTAGRFSLYSTSTNAVSDTYVQNTHNITLAIASQGSRSADLAITIPNPGNAVTTANILSDTDTNSYTLSGTYTLSNALTITPTTNQLILGTTRTATISAVQPATASRTYTFPDLSGNYNVVGDSGTQTIGGTKTFSSALTINPTTNQLVLGGSSGNSNTISSTAPATTSRTWTIPDISGNATFSALEGTQTFSGSKTFSSTLTMSGATIAMGSNKITGLAAASASGDALSWGNAFTIPAITVSTTAAAETAIHFQDNGTNTFEYYSQRAGGTTDHLRVFGYLNNKILLDIVNTATTSQVAITGTNTNDSAASGNVGEYISATVLRAAAITTTNSTAFQSLTSISLTAGDWDVTGVAAEFGGTATTGFDLEVYVGTSATAADGAYAVNIGETTSTSNGNGDSGTCIPNVRISLSTTTTVYIMVVTQFTTGTGKVYGRISARRIR